MFTVAQWKRQAGKLTVGIVLAAMAVGILSMCLGQVVATERTRESLNSRFTTIAVNDGGVLRIFVHWQPSPYQSVYER